MSFLVLIAACLAVMVGLLVLLMLPTLAIWFPRLSPLAADNDRHLAQASLALGLVLLGYNLASLTHDEQPWASLFVSASVAFMGWYRLRRLRDLKREDLVAPK